MTEQTSSRIASLAAKIGQMNTDEMTAYLNNTMRDLSDEEFSAAVRQICMSALTQFERERAEKPKTLRERVRRAWLGHA